MEEETLYYFGTSLDCAGHYFWELNEKMKRSDIYFFDLPFDPEQLTPFLKRNGQWLIIHHPKGYTILAIVGSCYDKRIGCKSVFWTKNRITLPQLIERINTNPTAMKIINQMPFSCELKTL